MLCGVNVPKWGMVGTEYGLFVPDTDPGVAFAFNIAGCPGINNNGLT